jgi:hypothetical protein
MSEPEAPPPLDQDLQALLGRAAGLEAAPPEARARLRARLLAGGGAGPGGNGPATALSGLPPPSGFLRRLAPLAVSFVLGGGAGGLIVAKMMRQPAPDAPRIVYVDRLVPAPLPAAPFATPEPPPVAEHAPASRAHRARAGSPEALALERQLLDVARGALERGEAAAALAATARHERLFPGGVLVQEREAMAIRALAMLGRLPEARARAARFRERFPDSVLWPAIASSIGSPSAP